MILFGHIGPTLYAASFLGGDRKLDRRACLWLAFWSILPDLLDKALFLMGLTHFATSRLWGHTLAASFICILIGRFWWKGAWPWVLAMPGHLVLDSMWWQPGTLFWPLLSPAFDRGVLACPVEVARQGLLAAQIWMWHYDPFGRILVLIADLAGLLLCVYVWQYKLKHVSAQAISEGPVALTDRSSALPEFSSPIRR
ncbi:MAG: metal-dependent hydrolase [Thermodesulfobacteriota bacterium]